MKNKNFIKKIIGIILCCFMTCSGIVVSAKDVGGSNANIGYVYYRSNGELYRTSYDGSGATVIASNFVSDYIKTTAKYTYYFASSFEENEDKPTTLLRTPNDGSNKAGEKVADNIVNLDSYGNTVYYLNDDGEIYSMQADAADATSAKKIADTVDVKEDQYWFGIIGDRLYYNSVRYGDEMWIASVALDGSGDKRWVTEGAVENDYMEKQYGNNAYLMVDKNPYENEYSTKCMVMYSINKSDDYGSAINISKPLDFNAVASGEWIDGYYIYNQGITAKASGDYNYSKGKAYMLSVTGKIIPLYKQSVESAANIGSDKVAFTDSKYNGYVSKIDGSKVSTQKKLTIKDNDAVFNLGGETDNKAATFMSYYGMYTIKPDLSLQKVEGIEYEGYWYQDDIPGIFYVNSANGKLYYASADGSINVKISGDKLGNDDLDGFYCASQY